MSNVGEFFFILLALVANLFTAPVAEVESSSYEPETAVVERVVDGDTIVVNLNGQEERVRYIGIDTPELAREDRPAECGAQAATTANESLVAGNEVTLTRDVSDRDRFDRLLRYVYVGDTFVQAALVEEGHAIAIKIKPDTKEFDVLDALESDARERAVGQWAACR